MAAMREVVWLHVGSTCSSSEQRVPETCGSPQDWVVSAFYGFWVVPVFIAALKHPARDGSVLCELIH